MFSIHFATILIASLAAFMLQFLINGPLFGKFYMRLAGAETAPPTHLPLRLTLNFIANTFTAYGIAVIYFFATTTFYFGPSIVSGILCGLFAWIVFLVPATSIDVIWNKKPLKLWLFEISAALIVLGVLGTLVAIVK